MIDFENRIQTFISKNIDIINRYESSGFTPIEYCLDDIEGLYNIFQKNNKDANFNTLLKKSLQDSLLKNQSIVQSLEDIVNNELKDIKSSNITHQYFKEINSIYKKHNNDYNITYCQENRDKLIEMNLKTVISIAKKYQGLGLTLNELISAGNLGLVIAWDKFDPNRSKLKEDMISALEGIKEDTADYSIIEDSVSKYLQYGDIKKKFVDRFVSGREYKVEEVKKWVNNNIYNAKFNSIATMWIRAYILIEIDNNSRVIKKPKSEIYKDKDLYGSYKKEMIVSINNPISDDNDTTLDELIYLEDTTDSDLEVSEAYNIYKEGLNKLLDGVKSRDRSIFLKKFGIGLPRPMLPKEIAEQEGLSIARISQILQTVISQMQKNQVKYNIDSNILFEAAKKIY